MSATDPNLPALERSADDGSQYIRIRVPSKSRLASYVVSLLSLVAVITGGSSYLGRQAPNWEDGEAHRRNRERIEALEQRANACEQQTRELSLDVRDMWRQLERRGGGER